MESCLSSALDHPTKRLLFTWNTHQLSGSSFKTRPISSTIIERSDQPIVLPVSIVWRRPHLQPKTITCPHETSIPSLIRMDQLMHANGSEADVKMDHFWWDTKKTKSSSVTCRQPHDLQFPRVVLYSPPRANLLPYPRHFIFWRFHRD